MNSIERSAHPTVRTCPHHPRCPAADASDHAAARVIARHPEQGWSLLCNGVVTFDDSGELLPDGTAIGAQLDNPSRMRRPLALAF